MLDIPSISVESLYSFQDIFDSKHLTEKLDIKIVSKIMNKLTIDLEL